MKQNSSINVMSPINQLGYGVAGLNIVSALNRSLDVALWPIGQPDCDNSHIPLVKECIARSELPDFNAPCLRIWHQHDMSQFVGRGDKIGLPIFELDKFTAQEEHHLSSLDRIIVCSEWAKEVCLKNISGNPRVFVAPLGVDRSIFKDSVSSRSETIFFNCGKWEIRKGHDVLVKAFNKAFTPDDDVELWMMCHNPFHSDEENQHWENLYKNSDLGDKIRIIPRQRTQQDVYNIMKQVDCGVFPSRAEGWNLELLELMSCGKHVIATNYSGHTEFCTKDNSMLIHAEEKEDAVDDKWFFGQGKWAKIGEEQVKQMVLYMGAIHRAKQSGRLFVNDECVKTAEKFSWNNTAKEIINAVST
jgi:glycosyltransferase involved in cell wall biosynthesis